MAAGINDKFKKVSADNSYAVATTVKTARTVGGGTTLEAFDLSKWADATAVSFLTYRKTTDPVTNITTTTNRAGWTALVNIGSNTLTNLTIAPGYTDLGHQVGDYIEPVQMSKWANDLVDGILVTHNQDGTLKANSVTTAAISNNAVTEGKLADNAVTTAKIPSNAVTTAKVAGNAITASKLDFTTLPKFRVYKDTNNQALANDSVTTLTFQVVDYNVGGGFSTSTNRFTAPVAGVYEFGARVRFDGGSGTPDRTVALQVNGSTVSSSSMLVGASGWSATCVDQLNLTAGQKVTAVVYTDTAGSTARNGYHTNFWGRRVG